MAAPTHELPDVSNNGRPQQFQYKLPNEPPQNLDFPPCTKIKVVKDHIRQKGGITTPFKL